MSDDDLKAQIGRWLGEQGYPLEFSTAAAFEEAGFGVMQGFFVEDTDADAPREIDVVAEINVRSGDDLVRVECLVECKWSSDKPWVVFCSPGTGLAPSACVAQTLGSNAASAALWARAGDPALHRLGIFATPAVPGFGGRQAFATGRDVFYDAMRSVSSIAHAHACSYDRHRPSLRDHFQVASVVLPMIVVRGRLFTARYDDSSKSLVLDECSSSRLHWRGSEKWSLNTTIDIVTESALPSFAAARREEAIQLAQAISSSLTDLRAAVQKRDLALWPTTLGPRGFWGGPAWVKELVDWEDSKR
jgi:hypothetical protein